MREEDAEEAEDEDEVEVAVEVVGEVAWEVETTWSYHPPLRATWLPSCSWRRFLETTRSLETPRSLGLDRRRRWRWMRR
jgi:hypothetical protein